MRELLRRLRDDGKTLLVSSHLLAEVDQIADWLIVLVAGKAVYCGPAASLPGRQSSEILVATESPAIAATRRWWKTATRALRLRRPSRPSSIGSRCSRAQPS